MFNKEFLKKLTILFAEDEELARRQLEKVLKRLFGKVYVAKNGLEAFQLYQEKKLSGENIDLILSDINMPQMSGIELLEKIREHDADIPFIFSTARSETEYLMKAISLNVFHYALKPVDLEDIVQKIEKVCEKKYYEKVIHDKTVELKEYLTIINSVAAIFKMNEEGIITFTNKQLLDSLKMTKEDVLGKPLHEIVSSEVNKALLDELFENIKAGNTWKSDLKFVNALEQKIYIKSTIFKVSNENFEEYINIGFISTDEVNEKREFHKKVLTNMKEKNINAAKMEDTIKKDELIISKLSNELAVIKQKNSDLNSQIHYYENELLNVDQRINKNFKVKNSEIETLKNSLTKVKHEKENYFKDLNKLNEDLATAKNEIDKLYEKIRQKEKRIIDLNDLVDIRESQLKKYDSSFEKN